MSTDEKLDFLCLKMLEIDVLLARFLPLLETYERASKARGIFQAKRVIREAQLNHG